MADNIFKEINRGYTFRILSYVELSLHNNLTEQVRWDPADISPILGSERNKKKIDSIGWQFAWKFCDANFDCLNWERFVEELQISLLLFPKLQLEIFQLPTYHFVFTKNEKYYAENP